MTKEYLSHTFLCKAMIATQQSGPYVLLCCGWFILPICGAIVLEMLILEKSESAIIHPSDFVCKSFVCAWMHAREDHTGQ